MASPRVKFDPERIISVAPPVNGLTTRYAPHKIPPGYASQLQNFLTHYNDKVCLRGPLGPVSSAAFAAGNATGMWEHDSGVLTTYHGFSTTRWAQPWTTAWLNDTNAAQLATDGGVLAVRSYTDTNGVLNHTTGVLGGASRGDSSLGPRYTRLKSYVYGPSFDCTAAAVGVGPGGTQFRLPNKLVVWKGTDSAGDIVAGGFGPVVLANGPLFCMDAVAHYERVFVAAGCAPGAAPGPATYEPNTLYYTAIDGIEAAAGAVTDTVARWQDQNGNLNKIFVGTSDDPIIALGIVNGNLVVFKRKSVWQLYGSSPSNFVVKKVTDRFGCLDPQSVCQINDQVTFMSQQGLMMFDGSRFTELTNSIWEGSGGIAAMLRNNGFMYRVSSIMSNCKVFNIHNNYLALVIETTPLAAAAPNLPVSVFCGICYVPKISWSTFSSPMFSGGVQGFSWYTRTPGGSVSSFRSFTQDAAFYFHTENIFNPETITSGGDGGSGVGPTQFEGKYGSPLIQTNPMEKSKLSQVVVEQYVRSNASVSPGALTLQDSLKNVGTIFKTFTAPTIADSQNLYVAPGDNATAPWNNNTFVGTFINAGSTITRPTTPVTPSGTNPLQITTTAASAFQGVLYPVTGTFLSGVAYTVSFMMRGNVGGELLGNGPEIVSSGTPADAQTISSITLTTGWVLYSLIWTPTANRSDAIIVMRDTNPGVAMTWFMDIDTIRVSKTASTHLLEKWTNDVYSEIGPEAYSIGLTINTSNLLQYELYNMFVKYEDTRTMRPSTTS